jgi:outer membrane protein TolC
MRARPWLLFCVVLLAGCSLAPPYTRPAPPVPGAFPQAGGAGAPADLPWTGFFTGPDLQAIIRLALDHNRDLRVSGLNVQKAQALYRIQRSALWPSLGAQALADRYRVPAKLSPTGQAYVYSEDLVQVGTLSWELDFFGRIGSLKDQALDRYLATGQAQAASRIALVASVAQGYQA